MYVSIKKINKTAFWTKVQDRPFSKLPMNPVIKIISNFACMALNYYHHFCKWLCKWHDICKIIGIVVGTQNAQWMIIMNTANKLLTDLGYKIVIEYKEQSFFLRRKEISGIFKYILVSKFLILKVFRAPSKHSLWGKKNLSLCLRITSSWPLTSTKRKSKMPVLVGQTVQFTSCPSFIDPVHCLARNLESTYLVKHLDLWPSI